MSTLADKLRALAAEAETTDTPWVGCAVVIAGDLVYRVALTELSKEPDRDAMRLGLMIYQATNMPPRDPEPPEI